MSRHTSTPLFRSTLTLVTCLAVIAFTASALAAEKGHAKGYGGHASSRTNEPTVNVPTVDPAAAQQAQQSLNEARTERKKAEDNLASLSARLREEFEKSPEMTQAIGDVKAAQAEYDSAAKPALEKVHATPEYKAANDAKTRDQVQIDQLRGTAGAETRIADLARDAMSKASDATKLETDAIAKDPSALTAKAKVAAANAKLSELRGQFNAGLTKNADWVAAKKAVDDAVQKLQTADAAYRQESGKLSSAQAAHNAAQAQKEKLDREYANGQKKAAANNTNNTGNQ